MSHLKINLLGYPQITLSKTKIEDLPAKAQALLFYLVVSRQQFSREHLAEMLWSDEDMPLDKKLNNLRGAGALLALNKILGNFLVIHRHSLAFRAESDFALDVATFEAALREPSPTEAQLQTAVDLYRGDFLAGLNCRNAVGFEEWSQRLRERLRRLAMNALYLQSVHHKQQHHYTAAIDCITRLLTLEPYFEEAHRELMILLALTGQVSEGCAHYERYWDSLAEEGLEPESETAVVYQQLLNGDILPEAEAPAIITTEPLKTWIPPFQAPAGVPHFVGRKTISRAILSAFQAENASAIQAIVGMGGVGKSSLAIEIAQTAQPDFPDGVLWASAATSEPTAVLESWAAAYGYDFSRIGDLESMANAFRGALADKKVLLVLDDVSSAARIKPLLPNGEAVRVLITTRDQDLAYAVDAGVWLLAELSAANGRTLLSNILGPKRVQAEAEAAADICNLLQNLPLALEIIGQRLKSRPRRKLADVAQRLHDEKQRLSELQISDREVRASFALSYATLGTNLKEMFALMGVFNGRSFSAETLAAIAQQNRYQTEDRIFALVALSLAQEEGDIRYTQHPLLADFAREQLAQRADEGEVYGRFAHTYLQFAQQNQHDYAALRPEWDNLMVAMQTAQDYEHWQAVIDFADALNDAWFTRGRYTQARRGFKWVDAATIKLNDVNKRGKNLIQWAQACIEQSDFSNAKLKLQETTAIFNKNQHLSHLADALYSLARIAIDQSEFAQATNLIDEVFTIHKQSHNQVGIADAIKAKARIAYGQGNYKLAQKLWQDALNIYILEKHQLRELQTIHLLVNSTLELSRLGASNLKEARKYSNRALKLADALHDEGEMAVSYYGSSRVYRDSGNLEEAEKQANLGLEIVKHIGDRRTEAILILQLCEIRFFQEDYETALAYGNQCLSLFIELKSRIQVAISWSNIGHCYQKLGKDDQAYQAWSNSLEIAKDLEHSVLVTRLLKLLGTDDLNGDS